MTYLDMVTNAPDVPQSEDCECPSSRLVKGEGGGGADRCDDDDDRLELERHPAHGYRDEREASGRCVDIRRVRLIH